MSITTTMPKKKGTKKKGRNLTKKEETVEGSAAKSGAKVQSWKEERFASDEDLTKQTKKKQDQTRKKSAETHGWSDNSRFTTHLLAGWV